MVGAVACYFAPILLAPWMGSRITGSFPSPPIADWRYEFGWVRWLTLQHDPTKPASGLQVEWTLEAAGVCPDPQRRLSRPARAIESAAALWSSIQSCGLGTAVSCCPQMLFRQR